MEFLEFHKLPEIIKTVMEYRNLRDENLSDQTAIDIAIEHNILPLFRPITSGMECLTGNMSAYVDKILQPFLQKIPCYIQESTQFLNCILNLFLIMLPSFQWMSMHCAVAAHNLIAYRYHYR